MKILEIKNNLVKIAYNSEDNLALSGFLVIEDTNNPYVAQIMNLKAGVDGNFAIAKLLFTFNSEGVLKSYNGTIPSLNASVSNIPSNELLDIIPIDNPLILGVLAQQNVTLKVDKSILENNLLICSNSLSNTEDLLVCITSQMNGEKGIIIDSEGQLRIDKKFVFSKDFKLPLNADTIDFIYENDLADVEAVNKAIIQDILIEVQNYVKTLPEKFLPFDTFINVIDLQYKETKMPELVLLKNKLLRYKEMNVFAQDLKEILDLNIAIEKSDLAVIDISEVTEDVQKEVIRHIYNVLNGINGKIYSFVKINNSNVTKRLLKRFIEKNNNVYTTIICPHEFKYIEDVKELSQNMIFYSPLTLTHDFASYNTYLNKLNSNEFVIYGAHTQNIPLIVETIDDADILRRETANFEQSQLDDTEKEENIEIINNDEEETSQIEEYQSEQTEYDNAEVVEEPQVEVIDQPQDFSDENIIVEEDEYNDTEIVETIDDEPKSQEEIEEQAAKDVDRAFYEKLPNYDDEISSDDETELTEDDLNLIDDLSSDEVPLADDGEEVHVVDEEVEDVPIVPIYPADDIEERDIGEFKAGDKVITEKYGEGIVEKMIKYGNKKLCSIEFPEVGKRLLDPAITDIKLLS